MFCHSQSLNRLRLLRTRTRSPSQVRNTVPRLLLLGQMTQCPRLSLSNRLSQLCHWLNKTVTDDSEELIPDRNNDPPSEAESDETRYYSSDEVDLVFDEKDWVYYTEDQKLCANTASFSMPRYMDGAPVDTSRVTSKVRHGATRYVRPTRRDKSDIQEDYFLLTEEDKATKLTFSLLSQKAQRKEATATEKRQMKKQFDEAKQAE